MITKLLTTVFFAAAIASSSLVYADHDYPAHNNSDQHKSQRSKHKHIAYAKVVDVDPIYKTIRISSPEQQCWYEDVHKPIKRHVRRNKPENVLIGGIIGGVIGHHLGEGHNRNVATLAGTLIGSAIGRDSGTRTVHTGEYQVSQERHCETHTTYRTEEQLQGYRVTYRYQGELFTTKTRQHPGKRIRVSVQITPVERDYY